mmetsp:Transcript_38159/g.99089  ORF Transcript_38159/g.99089 Transcript_38159/m.99089 type:complete len:153 (+) Transcript_38159:163-621(+)|eukprot:jgi/Tetstr1/465938/TSEL_010552.t1
MRAVVQRVTSASVEVDGQVVSRIGPGLLCLIGAAGGDTEKDAEYIGRKILNMRLFSNAETSKAWDKSVTDLNYEVLCVSQFTLLGRLKGNKPDYSRAMPPQEAREFYAGFIERLRKAHLPERIKDGVFGAMMNVALENDGPVTFNLDSRGGE